MYETKKQQNIRIAHNKLKAKILDIILIVEKENKLSLTEIIKVLAEIIKELLR